MAFFEDNAGPGIADASGPAALFGCAVRRGYPQAGSLSPEAIACGPLAQAAVQNITQFDKGSARRLRLYAYADHPKYSDK
ncbi:TPA: hypothetical protein NIF25_000080 [Pseudomonas aeruginosa]|uniref:hypothetical protein n=1 Tax=Pseudomonas aeruginosa TaxID=287 RepID=UPI0029DBB322|nr:hypothetical protein [Pseudomonas aeruginosa]HEJ3976364.1 hypothetical protein [Pseudomonas aeruginosa]